MLDLIDIPDDLLPNRADIYAATVTQDADGAFNPTYSDQPTWQQIPCNAQPREVEYVYDDQGRLTRLKHYHVFFNGDPGVSMRDKMVITNPDRSTRTIYVEVARNEGGFSQYFVVRAIERL